MDTSPNDRDESNRQAIVRANNRGVLVRKAMEEDEGGSRSREQTAELLWALPAKRLTSGDGTANSSLGRMRSAIGAFRCGNSIRPGDRFQT